jgi:hypothetical protein
MTDALKTIVGVPIPTILILVGLAFLAIAVIGKVSGKIEPGDVGRVAAGVIGGVLLLVGLGMHLGFVPAPRTAEAPAPKSPPAMPPPARILHLRAEPQNVSPGATVRLCYGVADARQARIEPEVGEVQVAEDNCIAVKPSKTTQYALTATGRDERVARQEVRVEVRAVARPEVKAEAKAPAPPAAILHFEARPESVPAGGRIELCYGVANARQARIEPEVGEVKPVEQACVSAAPKERTTYTLTALGPGSQQVSWRLTVAVETAALPPSPLQILDFSALPPAIPPGGKARLCYAVRGASKLSVEPEIGEVRLVEKNCVAVAPSQTTAYTLIAVGPDGREVRSRARIEVRADAQGSPPAAGSARILHFEAQPSTVSPGDRVSLCYGVTNARQARIEPEVGEVRPLEKECVRVAPSRTTAYTLIAVGPDGRETRSRAMVQVPAGQAAANDIRNLRILSESLTDLQITVDYTYSGDRGSDNIFLVAHALDAAGKEVPGIGVRVGRVEVGIDTITLGMKVRSTDIKAVSTTIRVCMYVRDPQRLDRFRCERFPHRRTWG